MVSQLTHFMDYLLGWLLRFPSDVQLFAVAIGSALILSAVRLWTTDQDLLKRCRKDKARLKTLLREAKAGRDSAAIKRHRTTLGLIAMKQLRQEGRPLLASLLPIVLLATWALSRLEFHPLQHGDRFQFTAQFPVSAVGKIAHVAPVDGLSAESGWIQEIAPNADYGTATWRLAATDCCLLSLRIDRETFEHPLLVGTRTYAAPVKTHSGHLLATEVKMRPVKLFGLVPGIPAIHFPAWLGAYLLLVIPSAVLVKRALKIY